MKKITLLAALLPTVLFSQNFEEMESPFQNFYYSNLDVADFDGDDRLDVVFNGAIDTDGDGSSELTVNEIYKENNESYSSFQELSQNATHLGAIRFIDFDNDGLKDLISTGLSYNDVVNYKQYRLKNTGNAFELLEELPGRIFSSIEVFDFDHNGYLDYALNGIQYVQDVGFSYAVELNVNSTNGFNNSPNWLAGTQNGDLKIADFNNDGLMDAAIIGYDENIAAIFKIYLNNQGTMELSQDLIPLADGRMAVADFNADGFQDLVALGLNDDQIETLVVYINNGTGEFTETIIEGEGMTGSSVDTGDLNNDGYYDFIVIGNDANSDGFTKVFVYDPSNSSFTKSNETGLYHLGSGGNVKLVDLNSDNNLDVIMNGFDWTAENYPSVTKVFKNLTSEVNLKPLAPSDLNLEIIGNKLNFSWTGASDDKTPSEALLYELTVGSTQGGKDIAHYLVSTNHWFLDLEQMPESLYWSVKSIDASKVYSDASEEQVLANIENEFNDYLIYPNPATDFVNVQSKSKIDQLELYSIQGQKLNVDFDGNKINVSNLSSGIYILKIESDKKIKNFKLIKK